jgi:pSer/pThr/pTyr-binding forkhead associated (FHA) protein
VRVLPPALRSVTPAELAERLQAERRGTPFALYLDGDGRQRIVELSDGRPLCIGRLASSDIALPWDTEVSRAHAMLEPVGEEWTLVDDGLSRNGSYVNGQRVRARQRLADGDTITVGRTVIVFAASGSELVPTETTRQSAPPELSAAQRRVLTALCRPFLEDAYAVPPSNREIADELVVSVETVKSHLHALFELFGVEDMPQNRKRAELVRRAFACGAGVG